MPCFISSTCMLMSWSVLLSFILVCTITVKKISMKWNSWLTIRTLYSHYTGRSVCVCVTKVDCNFIASSDTSLANHCRDNYYLIHRSYYVAVLLYCILWWRPQHVVKVSALIYCCWNRNNITMKWTMTERQPKTAWTALFANCYTYRWNEHSNIIVM